MKYYVNSKADGEKVKKYIRDRMYDHTYISEGTVLEYWRTPSPDAYGRGWRCAVIRKKMRIRETKNGWFLYLPEPEEWKVDKTPEIDSEMISVNGNIQLDNLGLRTCRVTSKLKGHKITKLGFFHGWFQLKVPKTDGDNIMYPIGIVEMEDGSVRQVKPDHIIFGWEG